MLNLLFDKIFLRGIITITLSLVYGTSTIASVFALTDFLSVGFLGYTIGVGLELGKFISILYTHRNWDSNKYFRYICILIAIPIMCLTTSELIGYLSFNHFKSVQSVKNHEKELIDLNNERDYLQNQIDRIENNLINLPAKYVKRREDARNSIDYKRMNKRISEIMQIKQKLSKNQKTCINGGPVYSTADLLGIQPEVVSKYFIILLVIVWEGLSTVLIISFSTVWKQDLRTNNKEKKQDNMRRNKYLTRIMKKHKLTTEKVALITKRREETVKKWTNNINEIPESVLRQIILYIKKEEVGSGSK